MRKLKKNRGFTLLEIIIVIIIIGVLASLALPRFIRTAEYSRATEALTNLSGMRQAMNRCFLQANSYALCTLAGLDVDIPAAGTTHFNYTLSAVAANTFTINAQRTELNGGNIADWIRIEEGGRKTGSGAFAGIR